VDVVKGSCVILRVNSVFLFLFLKGYFRVDAVRRSWAGQDQALDGIRCIGWR